MVGRLVSALLLFVPFPEGTFVVESDMSVGLSCANPTIKHTFDQNFIRVGRKED